MERAASPGVAQAPGPINGTSRDPADVLAGVLRLTIGGTPRDLPVLVMSKSRAWKSDLMAAIGSISLPPTGSYNPEWATQLATVVADKMVDLLASYDESYALSGQRTKAASRKWLNDHATDRELYVAFLEVLKATFPFVPDPRAMVLELVGDAIREQVVSRALEQGARANAATHLPSSGPSTTGAASAAPPTSEIAGQTSS